MSNASRKLSRSGTGHNPPAWRLEIRLLWGCCSCGAEADSGAAGQFGVQVQLPTLHQHPHPVADWPLASLLNLTMFYPLCRQHNLRMLICIHHRGLTDHFIIHRHHSLLDFSAMPNCQQVRGQGWAGVGWGGVGSRQGQAGVFPPNYSTCK